MGSIKYLGKVAKAKMMDMTETQAGMTIVLVLFALAVLAAA